MGQFAHELASTKKLFIFSMVSKVAISDKKPINYKKDTAPSPALVRPFDLNSPRFSNQGLKTRENHKEIPRQARHWFDHLI
ncbi:MAG: hypothetical protein AB3N10_16145 [Allomuricauda sp.]